MPRMESSPLLRSLSVSMAPNSIATMARFYRQTPLLLIHVQSSSAERTPCRSILRNHDCVTLVLNCYRMPSAGLPLRRRLPNKSVPLRSQDRSRSVSPGPASWTRSEARINVTSQSGWTSKEGNEHCHHRYRECPAALAAYLNNWMHQSRRSVRFQMERSSRRLGDP